MKKEIDAKEIAAVSAALMTTPNCRSVVKYLDEKTIVRATWHDKPRANSRIETMVVTIGAPNYKERGFIKRRKKDALALPKSIQYKYWPEKKKSS